MFIDYAINDISDADEMASFEVDAMNGGSASYWSSYNNPAAIKLVREAEAEFNPQTRAALYAQIQKIVAQDAPFVPLDYPPYICGSSKKVTGSPSTPAAPTGWRTSGWPERRDEIRREAPRLGGLRALGVTVATFLLLHVEPGDPARLVLGEHAPGVGGRSAASRVGARRSLPQPVRPLPVAASRTATSAARREPGLLDDADRPAHRPHRGARRAAILFAVLITVPLAAVAAARKDGPADQRRALVRVGLGCPRSGSGSS